VSCRQYRSSREEEVEGTAYEKELLRRMKILGFYPFIPESKESAQFSAQFARPEPGNGPPPTIELYEGALLTPAAFVDRARKSIPCPYRFRPEATPSSRWEPRSPRDSKHGGEPNSVPQFLRNPARPEFHLANTVFPDRACLSIRQSRDRLVSEQHCRL
jgi:hypothetical protein